MDITITRDGTTSLLKPSEEIHFDNYKEVEAKLLEEVEAQHDAGHVQ